MNIKFYKETNFKQTDLAPLPQEWKVVKLGEVFTEVDDNSRKIFIDKKFYYKTIITKLYAKGIQLKEIIEGSKIAANTMFLIKKDDFIFSKINIRKGAFDFVPEELDGAIVSSEHPILNLDVSKANQLFIKFYLSQPYTWEAFKQEAKGFSGKERVKVREFLSVSIPLPPLSEQKAIAEVLQTIQEAKEKTEAVIEATRNLKKSMMKHLFTYGNVPLSDVDKVKLKDTEIGPIPEHWQVVRLGEVCKRPQYGYTTNSTDKITGIKLLRITDIQNGTVDWSTVPYCEIPPEELNKYLLKSKDILVARIGATTGKTFLVKESPKVIFASYLIRLQVKSENIIDCNFLYFYTNTEVYWKQINSSKGGRLKQGINIPNLENLKIPLPPLPEQHAIAEILQAIDEKIQKEETRKKAIDNLFKSMLHNLMSGKLRIKI